MAISGSCELAYEENEPLYFAVKVGSYFCLIHLSLSLSQKLAIHARFLSPETCEQSYVFRRLWEHIQSRGSKQKTEVHVREENLFKIE